MEDPLITNDEGFADILEKFATWNDGEWPTIQLMCVVLLVFV